MQQYLKTVEQLIWTNETNKMSSETQLFQGFIKKIKLTLLTTQIFRYSEDWTRPKKPSPGLGRTVQSRETDTQARKAKMNKAGIKRVYNINKTSLNICMQPLIQQILQGRIQSNKKKIGSKIHKKVKNTKNTTK